MLMQALKGASTLAKRMAYLSVCLPVMKYSSEIQLSYEIRGGEPKGLQLGLWF